MYKSDGRLVREVCKPCTLHPRLTGSFADLIYRLGHPPLRQSKSTGLSVALAPNVIFQSWLNHHKPYSPGLGKRLFRLLFPHEGSRRRYGLKETKLSSELERILGLTGLRRWDSVCWDGGDGGTGCLGKEVESTMRRRVGPDSRTLS